MLTYIMHVACHFVAQYGRQGDAFCLFSTEDTHISTTYRVCANLDEDFVGSDVGRIHLRYFHLAGTLNHSCKHFIPPDIVSCHPLRPATCRATSCIRSRIWGYVAIYLST